MGWVAPIKDDATLERFKSELRSIDDKYYIMFEIGIGTGLLLQDILKLKNKDVYQKTSIDVIIGAKKVERSYQIPDNVQTIINDFCKGKAPDDFLITGHSSSKSPLSREQAYRVLSSTGQSLGLSTIGAQTMRKTFAWRYYKSTGDITYNQHLFNHASPSITYRYIGEKPNVQVILRKLTPEENERSRYMLYLNDSGRKRIDAIIHELNSIKDKFNDPCNNDAFFGCVECFLDEMDALIDNYKDTNTSHY